MGVELFQLLIVSRFLNSIWSELITLKKGMAEALLSSLLTVILGNLNSQVLQEFGTASGLKTEIGSLKSTFTTIQAVLQDAEAKQWKSEAVRNWLRKLKPAAYNADNILDKISIEALIRKVNRERGVKHRVSDFFSLRNSLVFMK